MTEVVCPGCRQRDGEIADLKRRVAELEALVRELTARLGANATNSSTPPSANPPQAPKPVAKAHSVGPRLAAALAYLAGCHHVSKRGLEEIAFAVFEVPLALGTVSHLEQQMSAALATPHAEALEAVRRAAVKHVDETGWKRAGQRRWLWLAATSAVAAFLIAVGRGFTALKALLGTDVIGFVTSDRWAVYDKWPLWRRQICLAHLKREFQKLVDRGGAAAPLGEALLRVERRVFEEWHLFRGGTVGRRALQNHLDAEARECER